MKVAACQLTEIRNDTNGAIALIRAETLAAGRAGANLGVLSGVFPPGLQRRPGPRR